MTSFVDFHRTQEKVTVTVQFLVVAVWEYIFYSPKYGKSNITEANVVLKFILLKITHLNKE